MTEWQDKARAAQVRKNRMLSFGPFAKGLLVDGKRGLFVVDPEDSSVTGWLLNEGTYAENELALASSVITPESDILIVGVHIGALAVPLSKRCKSMDAIEANPDTQVLLKANLLLNACNNVTLHCIAASDSREPISFLKSRDNSGGSKRKPIASHLPYVYDNPEVVTLDAWPLDELLGDKKYDLIIMDIEGSEYFALKGMQRILSKTKVIAVEFLPHHLLDVAAVTVSEFCDQIEPHFAWMYIPDDNVMVPASHVRDTLQSAYDNRRGYDAIYFLKEISDAWLQRWNIAKPNAD